MITREQTLAKVNAMFDALEASGRTPIGVGAVIVHEGYHEELGYATIGSQLLQITYPRTATALLGGIEALRHDTHRHMTYATMVVEDEGDA